METIKCPFTIAIDSAESQPFSFDGMMGRNSKGPATYEIAAVFKSLGRYPDGLGDYSILGHESDVAIERKSIEDVWGTVMGWDSERENNGRRTRFCKELENLAQIDSMVVVEADTGQCLRNMPGYGSKPAEINRKIFYRSVIAMQQDYRVPWLFAPGRRAAEQATFFFLKRWYKNHG